MNFWDNVKQTLKHNGITQIELAGACGLNIGTLKNQINKNVTPDLMAAYKIADFLGVSLEYLITGQKDDKQKLIDLENKLNQIKEILHD